MSTDFKVVCDETNNSPEDIAQNKMNVDFVIPMDLGFVERMLADGTRAMVRDADGLYRFIKRDSTNVG